MKRGKMYNLKEIKDLSKWKHSRPWIRRLNIVKTE